MSFLKNLVLWLFLIFTLSAQAATKECVLAQLPTFDWLGHAARSSYDEVLQLRITHDAAGNRRITGDWSSTYYTVYRDSREGWLYHNSGFAKDSTLYLPAQFEYHVVALQAINTIDGLVFGSRFSKLSMAPAQNAQFTGDENEIIKLHQQSTGNELFLIAPMISVTSPDSFQLDVPEESVQNIAVRVEDIDRHKERRDTMLTCFVDGAKSGDTIRIPNNPRDRTLYLEAYSYASIDGSYDNVASSSSSLGRIYPPTIPSPIGPACNRAEPEAPFAFATSEGFAVYAYGVTSVVTSVFFPTWGDVGGQDDLVWYEGVKQADGTTWKAMIDLRNHKAGNPEYGLFNVHVYMNTAIAQNQWCGTANFARYNIVPKPRE